jgi:hypothetical protein
LPFLPTVTKTVTAYGAKPAAIAVAERLRRRWIGIDITH